MSSTSKTKLPRLENILNALLADVSKRCHDPDEFSSILAAFLEEAECQEIEPKIRGADRNILNAPVYIKMLNTADKMIARHSNGSKKKMSKHVNDLKLSPMRLLAEHRRKLIMKSLGMDDLEEIDIPREAAMKRVENSFNSNSCALPQLSEKQLALAYNRRPRTVSKKNIASKVVSQDTKFVAMYDDYDVMKFRWLSLLPQTKNLVAEEAQVLPNSSANNSIKVKSIDEPIQGRYIDSLHFDKTVATIETTADSYSHRSVKSTSFPLDSANSGLIKKAGSYTMYSSPSSSDLKSKQVLRLSTT